MPKLLKIVFTFKSHPLHAKISTQTGMPVPDEKVKELSSNHMGHGGIVYSQKTNNWVGT